MATSASEDTKTSKMPIPTINGASTLAQTQQTQVLTAAIKKCQNILPELNIEHNDSAASSSKGSGCQNCCKAGIGALGMANRTPISAALLLSNVSFGGGGCGSSFLETPTPKIPDLLRTPTALLTSPTNLVASKSSVSEKKKTNRHDREESNNINFQGQKIQEVLF